jgi:hypothetical protein
MYQFYFPANVISGERATSTYLHTIQEDEFVYSWSGYGGKETLLPLLRIKFQLSNLKSVFLLCWKLYNEKESTVHKFTH